MKRKIKLYMKCTTDKYELPIAVEENPAKHNVKGQISIFDYLK